MNLDGLRDLVAYGEHRIQGGHRVLDNQGDLASPNMVHFALGLLEEILTVQNDAAGDDAAGGYRNQLHQGQHCYRLAGAGLADYAQGLSTPEVEADAVHGLDCAPPGREVGP